MLPQALAQGLFAEISSERYSIELMLIDHFKKMHSLNIRLGTRFAIEDLVLKFFGKGSQTQLIGDQAYAPLPCHTTMAPIVE